MTNDIMLKIATPYYGCANTEIQNKYGTSAYFKDGTLASIEALRDSDIPCLDVKVWSTYIDKGRNYLVNKSFSEEVRQKIDDDWTHILYVDADMAFTIDAVKQLLSRDVPIVSGVYQTREMNAACCGTLDNVTFKMKHSPLEGAGLKLAGWCGAGFLLIKKEVFENLDYPWFRRPLMRYYNEEDKLCQFTHGEDVGFCLNARKCGYDIRVDYECKVKHLI